MITVTTFDSTGEALIDMLQSIKSGKTQLPDFQRGWVWDDEHIKSLLASISLSYPIGAVMMLQTGNSDVRFKPRLIEGLVIDNPPEPERFILDGQQRLTALFQALLAGHVVTTRDIRGKTIHRWYYLDIAKALNANGDREDALVSLPEDRKIRNFRGEVVTDYSTQEFECQAELLPLPLVFDTVGLTNWQMKYLNVEPTHLQARLMRWNELMQTVIQRFQQYQIPLILLRKEVPKEAVCQVFEKVNTGGVSLTVFELLTATYAVDDFNLRDDWKVRSQQLKKYKILSTVQSDDFLQAITLLATYTKRLQSMTAGVSPEHAPGISCKRKEILKLELKDYLTWAKTVTEGFISAARLLYAQKIFDARDLPYRTQLTPLAAIMAILRERAENDGVRLKLARWYWCGVFGELYGGAIETRFARDLPEVLAWIDGGAEPVTVTDANFPPSRLLTLRTRNSAAYKGIYALLMRQGSKDFRTGDPIGVQAYFDEKIDIHHIFPQAWCRKQGIETRTKIYDSVVNKTPLSSKTNRIISDNPPSGYLERIQKTAGITEDRMNETLLSHLIDPVTLRSDDFTSFFKRRQATLLDGIEQAMGKSIARESTDLETVSVEDYDSIEEQNEITEEKR